MSVRAEPPTLTLGKSMQLFGTKMKLEFMGYYYNFSSFLVDFAIEHINKGVLVWQILKLFFHTENTYVLSAS
jgi:hypothetical protein